LSTKKGFLAISLLLALFAQAMGHAWTASITFDEGPHLAVGYTTLRTGDWRLQPVHIHPPLANVMAAAPLLLQSDLPDPRTVEGWEIASLSAVTDAVVWRYPHPARLALAGRLPIILLTMLLAALVFRWAADRYGMWGGLLALALLAFDPNLIAHGSLITTDMAVTLFIVLTLYLLDRYRRRPSPRRLPAVGVALGMALASKVSALLLVPTVGLLLLLLPQVHSPLRRLGAALVALLLAGLTLWAVYGFQVASLPGIPFPIPAATHLAIYRSLQEHYRLGHPAFLMGQNGERGWWYYFPVAFALKTPLPMLLLLAFAAICKLRIANCKLQSAICNLQSAIRNSPLTLFPALYALSALFSSVDIGYRHLLPLLPFLYIFVARLAADRRRPTADGRPPTADHLTARPSGKGQVASGKGQVASGKGQGARGKGQGAGAKRPPDRATARPDDQATTRPPTSRLTPHAPRITFLVLLAWYLFGTWRVAPHYLAFFNELAGGPAGGYRYLVDSNLDWGQNLGQLRDWMRATGVERVYYAHFSPARPQVYGVAADFLPPDPRAVPFAPFDPAPGFYAIGATVLQGVYTPDVNTYAWFRSHEPLARLGYALFLYRVPPREPPAWVALCAAPAPLLPPEAVWAGFGRTDLRLIPFDCGQSWVYPADDGRRRPGDYLLPPDAPPPPGATPELQARHPDGSPAYALFRVEAGGLPDFEGWEAGRIEGPLAFLGYRLDRTELTTGRVVTLWTFWRVEDVPARPLSLMAHLLGPDGRPVAVGDGLGVPVGAWRPSDIIVQRHRLPLPEGAVADRYAVVAGAYWLDTMERWPVRMADGSEADRMVLTTVGGGR